MSAIEYQGRTYIIGAATQGDFRHLKQVVREKLGDPVQAINKLDGLTGPDRRYLLDRAYEDMTAGVRPVSARAVLAWLEGEEGGAYMLWLLLRHNHPEVTLELAREIAESVEADELRAKMDLASGMAGNPTQPAGTPTT